MRTVGVVWGLLVWSMCAASGLSSEPAAGGDPKAGAAKLVRAALLAEASGNRESRRDLLREAMKQDPDCSLAHWYASEVRWGERWLPLEEVQRQAATDERLAEYRRLRDQLAGTPAGPLHLAVWCHEHGLAAESRVHWLQVLMAQPENEAARKALGVQWYQGQWLTEVQLDQAKQANSTLEYPYPPTAKAERQSMDRWTAPVAKWRRAVKQGDDSVRESLRMEVVCANDPPAIHALGSVLINGSRPGASDPKGYRLVSLALIDALDSCGKPWAVLQLAGHAVEHPTIEVRNAAADALKKRPRISYVPWLLSHMQSPISGSVAVTPHVAGGVMIRQAFEREGFDAVYRDIRAQYYCAGRPYIAYRPMRQTYETNIPQVAYRSWTNAENYAAITQNQVDRFNAAVADLNERIRCAMSRATGEKLDADPLSCQRWWTKYLCSYYELEQTASDASTASSPSYPYPYDYDQPPEGKKPVIEQWRTYGTPASVSVIVASCFPWNTKVWTLTGAVDINQIKPGDRVLSQQPFTGELSYQPVLQVTRRKPSPMIEIGLGREALRATRGHPFWVCGEGWKMAKELAVGMWLHSTEGPICIDRVSELSAARPWLEQPDGKPGQELSYNLVLEACHNYFVGEAKILVHDNTLFPLDGPVPAVPGLATP